MKKILNDLKLKFDNPNWALDPEFALIDTVLEQHPELIEIVKGDINDWLIAQELKRLLPKMEKVYDITLRHELLGESVPNKEKIFSIYEEHTDIIVKGKREAEFGHKVNLTTAVAI